MREILFRGHTGRKWIFGGIFPSDGSGGSHAIIYQQEPEVKKYPVYAETVGQYTGLKDKTGKKIFEGDVVQTPKYGAEDGRSQNCSGQSRFLVGYKDGSFTLENKSRAFCLRPDSDARVIGNIYDNPELLEED